MPVYRLEKEIVFPHPSEAEKDGLLAIGYGGRLTQECFCFQKNLK